MTTKIEPKGLSWVTDKKMHLGDPWFVVETANFMEQGNTLRTEVIKNYQIDMTQQYARFMVRADGGAGVDLGDEYVANVMRGELVEVLGEKPTAEQMTEFASIRNRAIPSGW